MALRWSEKHCTFSIPAVVQKRPMAKGRSILILITATSAPHLIIERDIFPENKKMFIIDLAVPRDIDENIGYLKDIELF